MGRRDKEGDGFERERESHTEARQCFDVCRWETTSKFEILRSNVSSFANIKFLVTVLPCLSIKTNRNRKHILLNIPSHKP